jgi:hypothetical protein
MTAFTILFAVGLLVIVGLWQTGNPAIIDRGDGQPRGMWDRHSPLHILGAALTAFAFGLTLQGHFYQSKLAFLASFVLWLIVEVAQKFPKDKQGGFFEPADVLWNGVGAAIGGFLVAAVL